MVIGLFLSIFGVRLIKAAFYIAGVISTIALISLIFYSELLEANTKAWAFWLILSLSILIGLAVGYLFARFEKLGAVVLAGWGGFTFGMILNEAFIYLAESEWLFWVSCICLSLICIGLVFKYYNKTLVYSTSLLGSYLLVRGMTFFGGHYYNEFYITNLSKTELISR
mmetsp:Transcript_17504/g.24087  ORF Transcript_17504/g.24087 Transcript_17504/m.24087 type:complete len:168 (+) Transcript_17504:642-1145(+)